MNVNLNVIKKIHFIGIGGIGLSAIAKLMKENNKEVSGSDLSASFITADLEKIGIKIYNKQGTENIFQDLDLVIYSTAVPANNPELKKARELKIKAITYPESLGLVFNNKFGIAICGTHGKSSVSAMAGLLLDDAKLDPSLIVGSIVPRFKSNLKIGKSEYFITEACEYERSFLNLNPKIIILNNIELDHTDYYKDIEDMKNAFKKFISHLSNDGVLICNGDDEEITNSKLQIPNKFKILSFGFDSANNIRAGNVKFKNGEVKFNVFYNNKNLGEFVLKVLGLFNIYNALGVIALGLVLKIPVEIIKNSLSNYSGIWRRFEIKGKYKNALVISDYAHHPTAVKATIEATRQFYPKKRIVIVFQPHQHNRTRKLYQDFLNSFDDADLVILSEIFDVAGREEKDDQSISSLNLVNDIKHKISPLKKGVKDISKLNLDSVFYAKDLEETRKLIDKNIKPNDILLIMGAGDIYKVANKIVIESKNKHLFTN